MIDEKKDNVVQLKDLRDTMRSRIEVLEDHTKRLELALETLRKEIARLRPEEFA